MCKALEKLAVAPIKLHSKFENKLSENDPITTRVEAATGYRPWTSTQLAAKTLKVNTGRKENQYYRPGAAGNPYG